MWDFAKISPARGGGGGGGGVGLVNEQVGHINVPYSLWCYLFCIMAELLGIETATKFRPILGGSCEKRFMKCPKAKFFLQILADFEYVVLQ